jgi:hypothetical protein
MYICSTLDKIYGVARMKNNPLIRIRTGISILNHSLAFITA